MSGAALSYKIVTSDEDDIPQGQYNINSECKPKAIMTLPTGVYRADHVGSLLRPEEILLAREELKNTDTTSLRSIEDKHIATVVEKQIANGLRSITDGEFRRAFFHLDYLVNLDGIKVEGDLASTNQGKDGTRPPRLVVEGKLGHSKPIQVDDFLFLQQQIERNGATHQATPKVCIPSPTMVHFRGGRDTIDTGAYPSLEPFFDDLARVYQEELDDLYKAGCRFVQLDDTNLAYLCDTGMRKEAETRHNSDAATLASQYADLINKSISKRPQDLVVGIHLCRGNFRSQWFAQGGYAPVAETLFKHLDVDVYFLEFDDARSGDFSPLRHLPDHKIVVLGVMSSKVRGLSDKAEIVRRVREAAEYCPRGLDQLCLSHQCGFSSTMEGNDLSEEEQWAKIRMEVEIAKELWGDDV